VKKSFREHHLLQIFESFETSILPLDLFLSHYFRAHKAIGSKDRKAISEALYGIIRWRALLDFLCEKPLSWDKRIAMYHAINPLDYLSDAKIPLHIRLSFPKNYFDYLSSFFSEKELEAFCLASNTKAPTTVRVNLLKTTREELLEKWKGSYKVFPCRYAKTGITFEEKINFFTLAEFKQGLFEVQDEGSQLIAELIDAKPKEQILDYCSGSGGKSLAFAPSMQRSGQIYLHDIRKRALEEAKRRLCRAGIQNAQFFPTEKSSLYYGKIDSVLLDVPCSGSGTLRRNPDMKWKFDPLKISNLVQEQREIFDQALKYVRPGGKIIYATCSVFPQENEEQVKFFQEKYNLSVNSELFRSFPKVGEMDGFFGAVLTKTSMMDK
jgi:16S rRNA (cytosine967-C5)-methyltransferase